MMAIRYVDYWLLNDKMLYEKDIARTLDVSCFAPLIMAANVMLPLAFHALPPIL